METMAIIKKNIRFNQTFNISQIKDFHWQNFANNKHES